MREFRLDLHIHTCLSPCGDSRMIPGTIIERARENGIDVLGVTDHNSAENAAAMMEAGRRAGVAILPGMEISSAEEAHVLALFDDLGRLMELQELVYSRLPGENDTEAFGRQYVVDADGYVEGECPRLLIGASDIPLEELVDAIRSRGGVAIASHVDRDAFSIPSQLGFIPPGLALNGVELSRGPSESDFGGFTAVRFSDAHRPEEIGRRVTIMFAAAPTARELGLSLRGEGGRYVRV